MRETGDGVREGEGEREMILSLFMSLIDSRMEMGAKQYFIRVIKTQEKD